MIKSWEFMELRVASLQSCPRIGLKSWSSKEFGVASLQSCTRIGLKSWSSRGLGSLRSSHARELV